MPIDVHFGPEAQARITEAVARAERLSRGQIVPVVVPKSDPYAEATWRGAMLVAAIATAIALLIPFPLTLGELVIVQLAFGAAGALLSTWDPVERLLAGRRTQEQAVRARALLAFQEHGLGRTSEGTGVLVFASLFEHRAVILGDHGIDGKMHASGNEWEVALAALTGGMKENDPARGFVEAIALIGARLAEHFPRDPAEHRPANELADAIRVERG